MDVHFARVLVRQVGQTRLIVLTVMFALVGAISSIVCMCNVDTIDTVVCDYLASHDPLRRTIIHVSSGLLTGMANFVWVVCFVLLHVRDFKTD